jgi:hypothetical protein
MRLKTFLTSLILGVTLSVGAVITITPVSQYPNTNAFSPTDLILIAIPNLHTNKNMTASNIFDAALNVSPPDFYLLQWRTVSTNQFVTPSQATNIAYQVGLVMSGPINGATISTISNIVQVYGGSLYQAISSILNQWSSIDPTNLSAKINIQGGAGNGNTFTNPTIVIVTTNIYLVATNAFTLGGAGTTNVDGGWTPVMNGGVAGQICATNVGGRAYAQWIPHDGPPGSVAGVGLLTNGLFLYYSDMSFTNWQTFNGLSPAPTNIGGVALTPVYVTNILTNTFTLYPPTTITAGANVTVLKDTPTDYLVSVPLPSAPPAWIKTCFTNDMSAPSLTFTNGQFPGATYNDIAFTNTVGSPILFYQAELLVVSTNGSFQYNGEGYHYALNERISLLSVSSDAGVYVPIGCRLSPDGYSVIADLGCKPWYLNYTYGPWAINFPPQVGGPYCGGWEAAYDSRSFRLLITIWTL